MGGRHETNPAEVLRIPVLTGDGVKVPVPLMMEAAYIIASELRRKAEGSWLKTKTWRKVAEGYAIVWEERYEPYGQHGGYLTDRQLDPSALNKVPGMIWVNIFYREDVQVRTWIHELAHYGLHAWLPPQLTLDLDDWTYDDDRAKVSHRIAEFVEGIFLTQQKTILRGTF